MLFQRPKRHKEQKNALECPFSSFCLQGVSLIRCVQPRGSEERGSFLSGVLSDKKAPTEPHHWDSDILIVPWLYWKPVRVPQKLYSSLKTNRTVLAIYKVLVDRGLMFVINMSLPNPWSTRLFSNFSFPICSLGEITYFSGLVDRLFHWHIILWQIHVH